MAAFAIDTTWQNIAHFDTCKTSKSRVKTSWGFSVTRFDYTGA